MDNIRAYYDAIDVIRERAQDSSCFLDETKQVLDRLNDRDAYFSHSTDDRPLPKDEKIQSVGIVIPDDSWNTDRAYVFAREKEEYGENIFFSCMHFEHAPDDDISFEGYGGNLLYNRDDIVRTPLSPFKYRVYYSLLEPVSPTPVEDVQVISPKYRPPDGRGTG